MGHPAYLRRSNRTSLSSSWAHQRTTLPPRTTAHPRHQRQTHARRKTQRVAATLQRPRPEIQPSWTQNVYAPANTPHNAVVAHIPISAFGTTRSQKLYSTRYALAASEARVGVLPEVGSQTMSSRPSASLPDSPLSLFSR